MKEVEKSLVSETEVINVLDLGDKNKKIKTSSILLKLFLW